MRILIQLTLALFAQQSEATNVFRCKGKDGITVFQHTPCPNPAETEMRYVYERQPDAPNRVMSEAEFVNRNRQQRAQQAAVNAVSGSNARGALGGSCVRDRFTPAGECLGTFGEYNAEGKIQAGLDRQAHRNGRGSSADLAAAAAPTQTNQYLGIDAKPSGQLVPIGGGRVKDKRTGERYNTVEVTPGVFKADESPAQANERVRKALEGE